MSTPSTDPTGTLGAIDAKNLLGALFLSGLFTWGLSGVVCTQLFTYIEKFPRDRPRNKFFAYSVVALEMVQTVALTVDYFRVLVRGSGHIQALGLVGTLWFGAPLLSSIIAFIAQIFYATRIHSLLGSYVLTFIVCMLSVTELAGGVATAIITKNAVVLDHLPHREFSITAGICAGANGLCDIIIAVSMLSYLLKRRSEGLRSTRRIVDRIIRLVVETGTITAVTAVSLVILTAIGVNGTYFAIPGTIMSKLYSCSMLALLNNRGNGDALVETECITKTHPGRAVTTLQFSVGQAGDTSRATTESNSGSTRGTQQSPSVWGAPEK